MSGPLAGITVVALDQAVSAPLASRTLADLGARVIKVENPQGGDFARHYDDVVDGMAAHVVWVNRGKESLALDLKDPRPPAGSTPRSRASSAWSPTREGQRTTSVPRGRSPRG